jgi:hypothetical protein
MNSLSGVQLIAAAGLQAGEGLAPPNISANLSAYNSIQTVNNWNIIYNNAAEVGVTASNTIALRSIGSNSFPQLFGQVPNDFSSNLGTGPLISITSARTSNLFAGSSTANVFLQTLGQAQSYAAQAALTINSAASAQWPNGANASVTGGFSEIAGNNISGVAEAFIQCGSLMTPSDIYNGLDGFSNAGCFLQLLNAGDNTIGNLHLNFFGKSIVDPSTGNSYIIDKDLFTMILDAPMGKTPDDTFQVASLNPFDALVGIAANAALVDTNDLDAVITFFGVSGSQINVWTDCLSLPIILGSAATNSIETSIGVTPLDSYALLKALSVNITGLNNIASIGDLGRTMYKIIPLIGTPNISAMPAPVSVSDFSNLKASVGPGSGANGNPTVDDILGSTNYNDALYSTIQVIKQLMGTTQYGNISSDTGNIANALVNGISTPVYLSNGNSYSDINSLCANGVVLINSTSASLENVAPTLANVSLLSAYNGIAETHNNSIALAPTVGLTPANIAGFASDSLAAITKLSGLTGIIMSVVQRFHAPSTKTNIDLPSQSAIFLQTPSPSALTAFPSQLSSMAASVASQTNLSALPSLSALSQIPGIDETTGLGLTSNLIDKTTISGQALSATITEAVNNQTLSASGLIPTSLMPNSNILPTLPTGINTLGGGLIKG